MKIEFEKPIELYSGDHVILVGLDANGGIQIDVTAHCASKDSLHEQVIFIDKSGDISNQSLRSDE